MRSSGRSGRGAVSPTLTKKAATPVKSLKLDKLRPSTQFVRRGLNNEKIELEHLRTIVTELRRDQKVVESVKSDNNLLRDQLARAAETNQTLDTLRGELEKVREEQGNQLAEIRQKHADELAQVRQE